MGYLGSKKIDQNDDFMTYRILKNNEEHDGKILVHAFLFCEMYMYRHSKYDILYGKLCKFYQLAI